jgi:hypothetical protein
MSKAKNIPWLMWGSTQIINHTVGLGGLNPISPEVQLASVDYGRPDTWTFFFQASVLSVVGVVDPNVVIVDFSLALGVGRSNVILPTFEEFRFTNVVANPNQVKYSASVVGPLRFVGDLGPNQISQLAAQTLQCSARVTIQGGAPPGTYNVAAAAFFAPRSHIRPDWYSKDALGGAER